MTSANHITRTFEVPGIERQDVMVLRDYNGFPYYGQEFISNNLVISIISNGISIGFYDKQEITFSKNSVSVVLPNHICKEKETTNDYEVDIVLISPRFMNEIAKSTAHRNFLRYHYTPIMRLTPEQCEILRRIVHSLHDVCRIDSSDRHDMLLNLINVLLSLIDAYQNKQDNHTVQMSHGYDVFNRFCNLLTEHYSESREVSFYADKLNLSSKYFSKLIHDATGYTASYWIEQHIAIQAQQLLRNRKDLNILEIGYSLGFDDLAHFSRYFKRVTSQSPRQYREKDTQRYEKTLRAQ